MSNDIAPARPDRNPHANQNQTEPASWNFNLSAAPVPPEPSAGYPEIRKNLQHASEMLALAGDHLSPDELQTIQDMLSAMKHTTRTHMAGRLLAKMKDRIAGLDHPESPDFGKKFITAFEKGNIRVRLDPWLPCNAAYCSYSYRKDRRGFINEITINPKRADDIDTFTLSVAHEIIHGLQKHVSPALQHSPFNPDTRVIAHPADWLMLELACERDAFTKESFIATLLATDNQSLREHHILITLEEFAAQAKLQPSLADTMVGIALSSLEHPYDKAHPRGKTYIDHYHGVAIRNYSAGMWNRHNENEKDLRFVRLEPEDLRQIGNYGVGPNSFGEHVLEPLFTRRQALSPEAREQFNQMCTDYNIPPLDQCQTLREYRKSTEQSAAPARNSAGRIQSAATFAMSLQ